MKSNSMVMEKLLQHLPQILSGVAVIGVGATAYLSGKNSIKAHEILKEKQSQNDGLAIKEKVKLTWKCYIPTLIALTATITCMIVSQKMSAAQVASMSAACGYLINQKTELEKKIKEEVGEETFQKIKKEVDEKITRDRYEDEWVEPTGNGDLLCYESYTGRWFFSSEKNVFDGLKDFIDYYKDNDYIAYNDLYGFLNLTPSYLGSELGWCSDEENGWSPNEIEFSTYYSDKIVPGKNVLMIDLKDERYFPYLDWMEM